MMLSVLASGIMYGIGNAHIHVAIALFMTIVDVIATYICLGVFQLNLDAIAFTTMGVRLRTKHAREIVSDMPDNNLYYYSTIHT